MGASINLKNIKDIYCDGTKIVKVYAGNKVVYQLNTETIDPTYNYFIFEISQALGKNTVILNNYRAGDETEWDGMTDWGDGTVDSELSHVYEKDGSYRVKTKYTLGVNKNTVDTNYYTENTSRDILVECLNININITDAGSFFQSCTSLKTVKLSRLNVNSITSTAYMFANCSSLKTIKGIKALDVSKVENMNSMFHGCNSLIDLDLKDWDTSKVQYMNRMFAGCYMPDVSNFNVSNVEYMEGMFAGCYVDGNHFKNWDTSKAYVMQSMFYGAFISNSIDLTGWDISNCSSMAYMFSGCKIENYIDISNLVIPQTCDIYRMFENTYCNTCMNVEHHVRHNGIPDSQWQIMAYNQ